MRASPLLRGRPAPRRCNELDPPRNFSCVPDAAEAEALESARDAVLAAPEKVEDHSWVAPENYTKSAFVLNLPGQTTGSYSRNLNHLWATGAVVLLWDASFVEWYFRRADVPRTGGRDAAAAATRILPRTDRGGAATATWIFRGRVATPPRPRRGYSAGRRVAATPRPRRGNFVETGGRLRYYPALGDGATHASVNRETAVGVVERLSRDDREAAALRRGAAAVDRSFVCADCIAAYRPLRPRLIRSRSRCHRGRNKDRPWAGRRDALATCIFREDESR